MVLIVLVMNAFPGVPRKDLTVVLVVVLCGLAEYGGFVKVRRLAPSAPPRRRRGRPSPEAPRGHLASAGHLAPVLPDPAVVPPG